MEPPRGAQESTLQPQVSGLRPLASSLLSVIVCPDCRQPLNEEAETLRCGACGAAFPLENSVPKLWPPSRAAELERTIAEFRGPHARMRQSRFLRVLLPPNPICDPGARQRIARVKELMARGLVLNLGAKDTQWGGHVVNVDLVLPTQDPELRAKSQEPGAKSQEPRAPSLILADIQRLPFADASVDGIICTNVLEHVADARACLDEITRVVKPGGHVYLTVPFVFPAHPDPLDRRRWTLDGLRHALPGFAELESGVCGGPWSAFVSTMPTLLASALSSFFLFNVVRCTLGWLLWPLKWLDHLAYRSDKAHMAAAGSYLVGKRS